VYVEALHKEATGGDSLSIGWSFEGGAPALIPAEHLEAFATHPDDQDDDYLPDSWEIAHGFDVGDNGLLYPEQRWDADPDGDGFTNLQDYQTGGDPYARGGNVGFCEWHTFLIGPNDGKLASLTSHPLFAGIPGATGYF